MPTAAPTHVRASDPRKSPTDGMRALSARYTQNRAYEIRRRPAISEFHFIRAVHQAVKYTRHDEVPWANQEHPGG